MATKPANPSLLSGQAQALASLPSAASNAVNDLSFGVTSGPPDTAQAASDGASALTRGLGGNPFDQNGVNADEQQFAGMGPWLEQNAPQVFKQMDGLVLRYELIAKNHLAQDTHWTYVKLGYPWSTLTKVPNRDLYEQALPYGSAGITIQAVPNKVWDLVNKTTETLLVDFPQAECEPLDDTEESQAACEMANRFLRQDASEQGTNDPELYHDRVARSMVTASAYIEYWVDPTGGGYVPLQILAHPLAVNPQNPLIGPDGMPSTDYVLRYVTAENQFTDDASQAAPQWQPKLRATKWGREHLRVFPESAPVDTAEKLIIVGFCTVGEAKKRWSQVAEMGDDQIKALCDWTPTRYLPLLPPFQRARWALTDGRDKEKAGSSDERILFYYHGYARACPDFPKGADVVISGAQGGLFLGRELNAAEVEVTKAQGKTRESRCLEIPVVQVTPRGDPDEQDPSGRAFVEMVAGAAEHNAFMAMSYGQKVGQTLNMPFAVSSTSAADHDTVKDAMDNGGFVTVTNMSELPKQLETAKMPEGFFNMYELSDEAINSMASAERASSGAENSKERSGKALQIAVERNNVTLTGMQTRVNNSYARGCRIKIERVMKDFSTTQQVQYVGEDGAYKQDEWTGVDFALVGKVRIKSGTGTLMGPDQKVQYLANLVAGQLLPAEEAIDAARQSYSSRLGLRANPHEEYVSRCVEAWLDGPPEGWSPGGVQADPMGQPVIDIATGQPQVTPPSWSPFVARPNDTEPRIAALWLKATSDAMSTVKYSSFPPEWRALLDQQYNQSRQAVAIAQSAGAGGAPGGKPPIQPSGQPTEPQHQSAPGTPAPQNPASLPHPRGAAA